MMGHYNYKLNVAPAIIEQNPEKLNMQIPQMKGILNFKCLLLLH